MTADVGAADCSAGAAETVVPVGGGVDGKRLFDVVVASAALIAAVPVLALIAVLVRVRLGAPVLFVQQRPGLHGELFDLYKFRTLRDAADDRGQPLPDADRMTPLGRTLRSSSLDELPELWNVVRGDMSLVGPRPLLPQYLDRDTPFQARRHEVRPGLTGLAQVKGRNALAWERRFELDVWYVDHRTPMLDARILLHTLVNVVRRQGITDGSATAEEFLGG